MFLKYLNKRILENKEVDVIDSFGNNLSVEELEDNQFKIGEVIVKLVSISDDEIYDYYIGDEKKGTLYNLEDHWVAISDIDKLEKEGKTKIDAIATILNIEGII